MFRPLESTTNQPQTIKVKLGETVIKTLGFFQQVYHEFPCCRSVSGLKHTSPKTHLKSLVVLLGDTKLQKKKSFMLKNLDFLASLIEKKIKSDAQFARTCCLIERK